MEFLCCFTCLIFMVLVPVLSGAAVEREWRITEGALRY